ncbi:MAG: hypothetical protein VX412_06785 [Pseudomonadota bacterium]|nr:hypothetical protein [Rhodobacteraceae bacterium G21628-S1]MEE2810478.1 hypothetical protein [Pseudomonadota bacterium]
MSKVWWFLCRRTTTTGALWLATAAGVAAGLGQIIFFVILFAASIAFDILTKGKRIGEEPK